jgi:hypothetical protein
MGLVISRGKATLYELATALSVEDLYDLIEIIQVDGHNAGIIRRWQESQKR